MGNGHLFFKRQPKYMEIALAPENVLNQFQSTYANEILSDYLPVSCGVPQGSVVGPLLFLIYINNLQECKLSPLSSSVLMYADHTSLTFSANTYATLEEKLNENINEVQKWLKSNKLTINFKKSIENIYNYLKSL